MSGGEDCIPDERIKHLSMLAGVVISEDSNFNSNTAWRTAAGLDTFNHSVNFFLYIISGQQFRTCFIQVVTCRQEAELRHSRERTIVSTISFSKPGTPTQLSPPSRVQRSLTSWRPVHIWRKKGKYVLNNGV